MTVYVDDAGGWTFLGRLGLRRHHLYADTLDELLLAADRAGASRRVRCRGTPAQHIRVTSRQRSELLTQGAVDIEWPSETAELLHERRLSGLW